MPLDFLSTLALKASHFALAWQKSRILPSQKNRKPFSGISGRDVMRVFRKFIPAAALFLLILSSFLSTAHSAEKEKTDLKFRWAFGAIRGPAGAPKVEPVSANSVFKSGDKLKMMIELQKRCFVYLIHYNEQGDVSMIFPYSLKQFDTDYQTARKYFVPKGEAWFQLDDKTGSETFYLIASEQRLLDIEFLYNNYASAEPSKRQDLAGQMLVEINGIRAQYLASPGQAEVLAKNNNPKRGFERATGADPTDIAGLAHEIAFNNIYSETFVIEHR
jgi:hypothetical protein